MIDQPGVAPLSAIDQPAAPSSVSCACGACWKAPDAVAEITAVTVRAAKMNFFMGLSPVSFAYPADRRTLPRMQTPQSELLHTARPSSSETARARLRDSVTGWRSPHANRQVGAATVSVIGQAAETSFVVGRSSGDCRNVPAVEPQNGCEGQSSSKKNFFM